jgi:hypothetical protein
MGKRSQLTWRLLLLVASVPLAALLALVLFDRISFAPRLEQVRSSVSQSSPEDQLPPAVMKKMILASEGDNLYWHVTRIVLNESLPKLPPRTSNFNTQYLLSILLMRLRVSESEAIAIYCSRTYVSPSFHGLSNVSRMLFNKPLSTLSPIEAATVAAWPRGPAYFSKHPATLIWQRDRIFAKANGGP